MNPEEAKFPALEAYEKEARMNEETKGILPIEKYERMLDGLFSILARDSHPPRDVLDYCNTIARLGEVKRSLSETRRFRDAMELAEQFKDAIEKEAHRMETLFSDEPLASTRFFDAETNEEIAYVVLEDGGYYWSILASMEEGDGAIQVPVDKDVLHPDPWAYAQQLYREAAIMVERLLSCRAVVRVEADSIKAVI